MMAGVDMLHIPYRGDPLPDLLGGQLQVNFGTIPGPVEYIRGGRLRPLAVTTALRSQVLPDIPTVAEFLPGYEASDWNGMRAPKNTPVEIVERLNREINVGLADPKLKRDWPNWAALCFPGSSADFGDLIAEETKKWGDVIRTANIKIG
jgi:tripartite-type tricarboxylate transporter receptor subunit TctC